MKSSNAKSSKSVPIHKKAAQTKPKSKLKKIIIQLIGWVISFGLLYWVFFVKLAGEVDISQVWATIAALDAPEGFLLLLAGLLTVLAVGWTAATVLPGLAVFKGTQASVVGQLTSVALPPPLDMVIRFTMYRTYGFSNDRSVIAVAIAGIARYFTVVAIPIIGLLAVLITGQGNWSYFWWFVGLSTLFFVALWIMARVLASVPFATKIGKICESIVNRVYKWIRRKPNTTIASGIVNFGTRTKEVSFSNFWPIAVSNIVWGLSCFLVFFLAVRFCGIPEETFSTAFILLITGVMLLLSSIPITPGGVGLPEAVLMSTIVFPSTAVQTAFTSALFLYRVFTWLMPMPLGAVSYFWWRYETAHSKKPAAVKV